MAFWLMKNRQLLIYPVLTGALCVSTLSSAANLLDPANGSEITAIQSQLNNSNWAAANLVDGNTATRWLSSSQVNDLNFIFNASKDVACFNQLDLTNYGNDDRSLSRFMLFRTLDGALSSDTGTTGWIPIPADLNPTGPINHLNWAQGGTLELIDSQLNTTNWAAKNIHDGNYHSWWLSQKANNTLQFSFDTNWDGIATDTVNIKSFKIYNYGADDRSVKSFQIEVTQDGVNWNKLVVPGTNAGDSDFNFALSWHGGSLSGIDSQLNTTSWAAKNIHDGDINSRWLSRKGNNTLDFKFDVDGDGTSGADGDDDDRFTLKKFYLINYGVDDRSVKEFQVEVKTTGTPTWTKLKVPGSVAGVPDFNFLPGIHGGILESIDSQLNTTNWAAKNIHDGDDNTRWLSSKGNNTLDFKFDVDLDGTSGADGDPDDLFTMEKFILRNYGVDDRSIKLFQVEVKTSANGNWHKLKVPGSAANQPGYNFSLAANGGALTSIDSQLNTTSWAAKNMHDGDNATRWLSNKQTNTLEFRFDTDLDTSTGDTINLDTLELVNYGADDRSVQTFEIDIKISNGAWQAVSSPLGGTVFNANMDANGQSWSIGPFANVTDARIRTLSNHGDASYTGARQITFSGDSVGPNYTFSAPMSGNEQVYMVDALTKPVNVKNVRLRTINNHGDPSYTGAREFKVLGNSLGASHTFTADMNSSIKTFSLPLAEQPDNVTDVRFRSINNYGDPSYTGAREFGILGDSLAPGTTFSVPMTTGPHTITLDNEDTVSNIIGARLVTINNHGDPSYTGMRELEFLGDPEGPDYIFKPDMNNALQSFNFTPSMGRVFRLHTLSNYGDPSYTGADELALYSSNNCIMSEWRMDETRWNGLFSEVKDTSGNGYHGRAVHSATTLEASDPLVNGGICRVGNFSDGNYVEVPSFPNIVESFSVTGWFKTQNNAERGQRIFADDETSAGGYALSVGDPGRGRIRFYHRSFNPVSLDTSPNLIANNQWYFSAAVLTILPGNKANKDLYLYDVSGNLLQHVSRQVNGTVEASTGLASLGGEVDGAETNNRFKGYLDEVKVFKGGLTQVEIQSIVDFERAQKNWDGSTRACALSSVLDHIEISHDGQGLTCAPETITLKACQNADCSTLYTGDVQITLLPADANSRWTGGSTISNGTLNLQLSHIQAEAVNLGISSSAPVANNSVVCDKSGANDCQLLFSDSGFKFTINAQDSCKVSSDITIEAVKKSDDSISCVPAFSGNRSIQFVTTYNSPASGSKKIAITPVGGSEEVNPDKNPVSINFDPGSNRFKARYDDAGRVTLTANYSDGTGLQMSGNQTFSVVPDRLSVLARLPGAGATLNAISAGSSPTRKAGSEAFEVQVMAECVDDNGSVKQAKNFKADVTITGENPLPLPGVLGALGGTTTRNDFSQSGSVYDLLLFDDITYGEVGYFTLRADVRNYLGVRNLTGTQVTGRFVPDHFALVNGTVSVTNDAQWNGNFVYMDQAKITVDYLLEAQNSNSVLTQNYNDINGFAPATISPTAENNDDGNDLSARVVPGIFGTWSNGQMIFTQDNILFSRTTVPDGVFSSLKIGLKLNDQESAVDIPLLALDSNATIAGACNPLSSCDAKSLGASIDVRYGRMAIDNAYGSELLPLNMPLYIQYFNGSEFVLNEDDSYTTLTGSDLILSNNQTSEGQQTDGDVEINTLNVSTHLSSFGSAITSTSVITFNAGDAGLSFSAPLPDTVNRTGYTNVLLQNIDNWLLYDWAGNGDTVPSEAKASFGIYNRSKRLIYTKEIY